jgi:phage I-like protein
MAHKVVKENKVMYVHEDLLATYLQDGFDHVAENGELIKRATGGRSVSLAEHNKVVDELEALKEKQNDSETEQKLTDAREEIKVLEAENDRLDKLVKQLKGNQNRK